MVQNKIMTTLLTFLTCVCMAVTLAACGKCDHTYDNACDASCNECGEAREVGAHDFAAADCDTPKACKHCGVTEGEALGHTWGTADCENPKTCSVCGETEGEGNGHLPYEDDGNCLTAVKCSICQEILEEGKTNHIPHADDDDCTTPVTCTACDAETTAAKSHNFTGAYASDADGHWHVCGNEGCTTTDTKAGHNEGTDGKCTDCGYVVREIVPHTHTYTVKKHSETEHWLVCSSCGTEMADSRESHSVTPNNDCTTDDKCSGCDYVETAKEDHAPGEDDGNCTTPIKCVHCEQDAVAGYEAHNDNNGDYDCDNPGCQVVTEGAPDG